MHRIAKLYGVVYEGSRLCQHWLHTGALGALRNRVFRTACPLSFPRFLARLLDQLPRM